MKKALDPLQAAPEGPAPLETTTELNITLASVVASLQIRKLAICYDIELDKAGETTHMKRPKPPIFM